MLMNPTCYPNNMPYCRVGTSWSALKTTGFVVCRQANLTVVIGNLKFPLGDDGTDICTIIVIMRLL